MKMPNLHMTPLGLFAELLSPAALLEVPSQKGMSTLPIISLEHCKMKKTISMSTNRCRPSLI
jgi:hypothetical protein